MNVDHVPLCVTSSALAGGTGPWLVSAMRCRSRRTGSVHWKWRPHVAAMDPALAGMDGIRVTMRLRRMPGLEHIGLVGLTGPCILRRWREAGCSGVLAKALQLEEMIALLDAAARSPSCPVPRSACGAAA